MLHVVLNLLISELTTDQALESENRVLGIDHGLALRWQSDQALSVLRKRNDRGSRPSTFRVLNHTRCLALHDGHARVRRSQVNANHRA